MHDKDAGVTTNLGPPCLKRGVPSLRWDAELRVFLFPSPSGGIGSKISHYSRVSMHFKPFHGWACIAVLFRLCWWDQGSQDPIWI